MQGPGATRVYRAKIHDYAGDRLGCITAIVYRFAEAALDRSQSRLPVLLS
jgi:hypothetical protein